MSKWTKKAAIERMNNNIVLQEALRAEPRLQEIIDEAVKQHNVKGYHRIRTYDALKSRIEPLVGFQCSQSRIKTMHHYNAVLRTIDDLLPSDDVDLYPEGKPEAFS